MRRKRQCADSLPQSIGILIPTYRRSDDLTRCLRSLHLQSRPADEILLIVRADDTETHIALSAFGSELPVRVIKTTIPGTVHAHNLGIELSTTDVVAMIDDDTVPHPEWLQRVLESFQEDPCLGALGGRDRCFDGISFDDRQRKIVGKLQWYGRAIGNHHLGYGFPREVDLLKGANMSYRKLALQSARCDTRLRGKGAQPNEDISLSLAVKAQGWKVMYDPAVIVDHYQGSREDARFYGGIMPIANAEAFEEFCFNEVVGIWSYLSIPRKAVFLVWSFSVGTGVCPGFVQAVRFTRKLGGQSWYRYWLAQRGKFQALLYLFRHS